MFLSNQTELVMTELSSIERKEMKTEQKVNKFNLDEELLEQELSSSPFKDFIKNEDGLVKPVLIISSDSGPAENPRYRKVMAHAIEHLKKGDLTRDRKSQIKVFKDSNSIITGLAIKSTGKQNHLFVSTNNSINLYDITIKDKESKSSLDNVGCSKSCSILAESKQDSHFMIGRNDAVYCYTLDGRGPCYAVDGQKVMLEWFRNYLVIIAQDTKIINRTTVSAKPSSIEPISQGADKHVITILDIQNKFIVFSASMTVVQAILSEWGGLFILSGDSKLYHLDEKDLQSKLALLFKKNLYDVSIRIAKNQHYDAEGLIDIFRQYGDHLYLKGDYNGAIDQYVKTIGKLEPSYVIRKFLDSQHTDYLTTYLQALHKQGQATEDHTTLLLNCYTKLNHTDQLKEFIMTKDREVDFDVDIAIKVCRQGSPEDALFLAKKHEKHDWYLCIQIEDKAEYKKALEYIGSLDLKQAEMNMKKYGKILIENVPSEATQFLKVLCTNCISNRGAKENCTEKANPEDYLHLFMNNSERLVEFLEHLVKIDYKWSTTVYNTLVEHYLHVWSSLNNEILRLQCEQKIAYLLKNPNACYDKHQLLILCQQHDFKEGVLYLYEERKLHQDILLYYMRRKDCQHVLSTCYKYGYQNPNLWIQALWSVVWNKQTTPTLLSDILDYIAKEKLLSPLIVINTVSTSYSCTLGDVRSYLNNVLRQGYNQVQVDKELIEKYKMDTEKLRELIQSIKDDTIIFQGSRCSACHHQLELPSVHFMCQHSYHQHCFQSFSENENECPACMPCNKKWLDIMKAQEQSKDLHETFHSLLDRAEDPFSIVADYFCRGVFKKLMVISEWQRYKQRTLTSKIKQKIVKQEHDTDCTAHEVTADVDICLNENKNSFTVVGKVDQWRASNDFLPSPAATGDLLQALNKQDFYSFSLASNAINSDFSIPGTNLRKESIHEINNSKQSPKSSPVEKACVLPMSPIVPLNPFIDEYDEFKNPFAERDTENINDTYNKKDPLREDDKDYDKNLN
ncbi:vacuolar protein sorting-associated protein 11 homolog, partial [Copidosoma floridanum]|uniref:vacuolar protein sorting-associated protein 11 homolog n=1 Tax=Copidosoma floridanum TaxID=29053 RepID=UPI0006C9DC04